MVSWQASSASFSRRFVSSKLYVHNPLLFFVGPDCTCRDKRLNVSGGSMQSVEAGDLFEIYIPSFMPSSHTNASLHLRRTQYLYHPCIVDI